MVFSSFYSLDSKQNQVLMVFVPIQGDKTR